MNTLLFVFALLLPSSVSAHGDSPSFESVTNGYLIDIGYDSIGFRPNEPILFDFDLFTEDASSFVPFSTVQLEIAHEGVTTFDQTIANNGVNIPSLSITFEKTGAHVLHASFMSGAEILAYDTYPIDVSTNAGTVGRFGNMATYAIAAILGIAALGAIVTSFRRRTS